MSTSNNSDSNRGRVCCLTVKIPCSIRADIDNWKLENWSPPRNFTVRDLKLKLEREHPCAPDASEQRLVWRGRILTDESEVWSTIFGVSTTTDDNFNESNGDNGECQFVETVHLVTSDGKYEIRRDPLAKAHNSAEGGNLNAEEQKINDIINTNDATDSGSSSGVKPITTEELVEYILLDGIPYRLVFAKSSLMNSSYPANLVPDSIIPILNNLASSSLSNTNHYNAPSSSIPSTSSSPPSFNRSFNFTIRLVQNGNQSNNNNNVNVNVRRQFFPNFFFANNNNNNGNNNINNFNLNAISRRIFSYWLILLSWSWKLIILSMLLANQTSWYRIALVVVIGLLVYTRLWNRITTSWFRRVRARQNVERSGGEGVDAATREAVERDEETNPLIPNNAEQPSNASTSSNSNPIATPPPTPATTNATTNAANSNVIIRFGHELFALVGPFIASIFPVNWDEINGNGNPGNNNENNNNNNNNMDMNVENNVLI